MGFEVIGFLCCVLGLQTPSQTPTRTPRTGPGSGHMPLPGTVQTPGTAERYNIPTGGTPFTPGGTLLRVVVEFLR